MCFSNQISFGNFFPTINYAQFRADCFKSSAFNLFSEGLKATMITKFPENIWFNIAVVGILALIFIIIGALVTRWKEN